MSGGHGSFFDIPPPKGGRTPGPVGTSDSSAFGRRGPVGMHLVQQRSAQQTAPGTGTGTGTSGPQTLVQTALASLTLGYAFDPPAMDVLREALRAFADRQLNAFVDAGVRFWPTGSLPPNIDAVMETPGDPEYGHYIVQARTIRIRPNFWRRHIVTHELVHAWDRLRERNSLRSFHNMNQSQLRRAIVRENRIRAWSETHLASAYQNYRTTLLRRFGRNGNPTQDTYSMAFDTLRGYSFRHNVREFYAEGYAIFQFGSQHRRARMFALARDIYDVLRNEAQADGLPVPNQAELQQLARQDRLIR